MGDYLPGRCQVHALPLYHAGTYAQCDKGCMIEGRLAPGAIIDGPRDAIMIPRLSSVAAVMSDPTPGPVAAMILGRTPEFHDKGIEITVTRSGGTDGAVVIYIDTPNWEPNGSDGGPGLRVMINDFTTYEAVKHTCESGDSFREAGTVRLTCTLDDIDYVDAPAAWDPHGDQKHRYYEENQ